jgi:hypothetical protein
MHPQGNTAHFLLTGDRYLCGMPKPNTHVQLPESAIPGVSPCSRCYAAKSRREITKVATATPPKKSTLEGLLETMAEHNAKLASRKINWKQYRKRAVETERAILAERQRIASSLTPEATA